MSKIKLVTMIGVLFLITISQSVTARDLSDSEKEIISKSVIKELKDPESARFKWLPIPDGEVSTYCGLVNSKNSMGGYVGDVPYITFLTWIDHKIGFGFIIRIGDADSESATTQAILIQCEKAGYENFFLAE